MHDTCSHICTWRTTTSAQARACTESAPSPPTQQEPQAVTHHPASILNVQRHGKALSGLASHAWKRRSHTVMRTNHGTQVPRTVVCSRRVPIAAVTLSNCCSKSPTRSLKSCRFGLGGLGCKALLGAGPRVPSAERIAGSRTQSSDARSARSGWSAM